MLNRRQLLAFTSVCTVAAGELLPRLAHAQSATGKAAAFIKSTGDRLVSVVNGPGDAAQKRQQLTKIVDDTVDVDGIARFCLGRFWRQASPDQQKRYLAAFHQVLVTSITAKIGEYQVPVDPTASKKMQGNVTVGVRPEAWRIYPIPFLRWWNLSTDLSQDLAASQGSALLCRG